MKPSLFLLFLFIIPCVLADDIDLILQQDTYAPHETAQVQIILAPNISLASPLSANQFKLTDINNTKLNIIQSLTQLWSKEYYHTFEIPTDTPLGTYTLGFYNLFYTKDGKQIQTNILRNITIAPRNTTLLLRPAFLYQTINTLEQPTFRIMLINTGMLTTFTLNSTHPLFQPQPSTITLQPNEQTTFTLTTHVANDPQSSYSAHILIHADAHTYTLPIILTRAGTPNHYFLVQRDYIPPTPANTTTTSSYGTITLDSIRSIDQTIKPDEQLTGHLTFTYTAEKPPTTLNLVLTNELRDIISFTPETLSLTPGQQYTIDILINPHKSATHDAEGELRFMTQDGTQLASLPISLLVEKKTSAVENTTRTQPVINQTSSLPPEQKSNTLLYSIIGSIVLLALIFGYVLYQRGKPKPEKFEDLLTKAMQH